MPNCELCGKSVDELTTTKVSGAELDVCQDCTQHGTALEDNSEDSNTSTKYSTSSSSSTSSGRQTNSSSRSQNTDNRNKTDGYDDLSELALNYGELIQDARNMEGINRDELARDLGIKSSHLKNIEDKKTQPNVELQQKIERRLGIDLSMDEVDY